MKMTKRIDVNIRQQHQKQQKLNSILRLLRYGEKKKIIELRFGKLGSMEENGLSFS